MYEIHPAWASSEMSGLDLVVDKDACYKLRVIDSCEPCPTAELSVESDCTLADLRALVLSLSLLTTEHVMSGQRQLGICFDGRILTEDQDEMSLQALGIFDTPVLVVLALSPQASVASPKIVATTSPPASTSAAPPPARTTKPLARATQPPASAAEAKFTGTHAQFTAADIIEASAPTPALAALPPAPAAFPSADAVLPADAVCRICFGGSHENGAGRLISPCRCAGSMRCGRPHAPTGSSDHGPHAYAAPDPLH